ncbi:extracellular solute-binding protein [Paenibacillus pasadenensis]|uniref:extracellular solute-binding protein n=1 Tax=Paenibacillus pasadenensis TaxID=217090 RepID=UPI0020409543|nr:extracellular solute-binding protein [Paenibacillus pasadenensis]MCM3747869.1 extracellular solute-binding protein [Paenibacillus pasadenensis]
MKKKTIQKAKLVSALMAAMLAAAGCQAGSGDSGSTGNKGTDASPQPSASAAPGTASEPKNPMPIVTDGSVTLTVAAPDNPYAAASLAQNLPVWQEIEKATGVKIKWDVVPGSQFQTAMQTRLASGTNLPDVILSTFDLYKYSKDGLLLQLDDLIAKYGENAVKVFEAKPLLPALMKTPEGNTFHLSGTRDDEVAAGPYGWLIRKDWLDQLGLAEPVTVDDWYSVLKAFKEKDPNGNGKQDEIPMTNYNGVTQLYNWGNAWGLHLRTSDGFYPDANGKIQYEWLDPKAKEMVVFLNKLVKEGLLDMEFAVNKKDQMTSKIIRSLSGATLAWQESNTLWTNKLREAGQPKAQWVMTTPPGGPNGYKGHIEKTGVVNGYAVINKKSPNAEAAFRWLDYVIYNEENMKRMTLGVEGKTYEMKDGQPVMTDFVTQNPDGLGAVEVIRSVGGWQLFSQASKLDYIAKLKQTDEILAERAKLVQPYLVPTAEFAMPTEDEFTKINRKLTDITTYKDEMVAKFILGQEPIDKWDQFTKQIQAIGIDEVVAIRQSQYDRLMSQNQK